MKYLFYINELIEIISDLTSIKIEVKKRKGLIYLVSGQNVIYSGTEKECYAFMRGMFEFNRFANIDPALNLFNVSRETESED